MDGLNIGKILAGLRNPALYLKKITQENVNSETGSFNSTFSQAKSNTAPNPLNTLILNNQLQMNNLAALDRSVYIKNLLGLPQTLGEILILAQSKAPITTNTLLLNNLNEDIVKSQKILSQIFDENIELTSDKLQNQIQQIQNSQNTSTKDVVSLMFSGMIHLPAVSEMILKNSKHAVAGLIIAMASASKHGMTNEQISETLNIINSCVAMAESGSPAQTIKSLMLLYLPWLPLNEGVGFDLEVETNNGESESNDSKLTVLIQTRNYGNVKGVFTLTTSNSVDIYIICANGFPKTLLQKSLVEEGSSHAMTMTIDVEEIEPKNTEPAEKQEAKVNLSATNEMNPYLLLMAHAFIRNTILIDSNAITGNSTAEN